MSSSQHDLLLERDNGPKFSKLSIAAAASSFGNDAPSLTDGDSIMSTPEVMPDQQQHPGFRITRRHSQDSGLFEEECPKTESTSTLEGEEDEEGFGYAAGGKDETDKEGGECVKDSEDQCDNNGEDKGKLGDCTKEIEDSPAGAKNESEEGTIQEDEDDDSSDTSLSTLQSVNTVEEESLSQ